MSALEQYGSAEYIRKTLLGIQMAGGAEEFFRNLSGPSRDALADAQQRLHGDLNNRLEQTKQAMRELPIWERLIAPSQQYRELRSQQAGLEEQLGIVESRLNKLQPGWEDVWDVWNWSEVEKWEREQLAEAEQAEREAFTKQAESLVYPDALPVGNSVSVTQAQLKSIGWKNVDDELMLGLQDAIERCEINTPMRLLFFLTMITHEGDYNRGDLTEDKSKTYTKESIKKGTYRGAGYLQLTGEKNYRVFSEYMNDPLILEKGADYVAQKYPWESAIWFWNYRRINKYIDEVGTLDAVTERIRGDNQVASPGRWETYNKAYAALFGENS